MNCCVWQMYVYYVIIVVQHNNVSVFSMFTKRLSNLCDVPMKAIYQNYFEKSFYG